MQQLLDGRTPAPDFARNWLAARRRALAEGERVREKFERILRDVFYALDDYVIDPELRDPNDMTDDELTAHVQEASRQLEEL